MQHIVDFIQKVKPHAIEVERVTGVPAIVAMAQAALETGWGKHAPGNMFFGMKAKGKKYGGWDGKTRQLLKTWEFHDTPDMEYPEVISITQVGPVKWKYRVRDWFRAYETPWGSFQDYGGLISTAGIYRNAMKASFDPELMVERIAAAGYATAPDYADQLKRIMRTIRKHTNI